VVESVYSAVRTGSLNKVVCASCLKGYWINLIQNPPYSPKNKSFTVNNLPVAREGFADFEWYL